MTLEDKLKEIEGHSKLDADAICISSKLFVPWLLAALRKCREQRRENALGWEQFDYEFEAHWSEEKDDAELLALLQREGE